MTIRHFLDIDPLDTKTVRKIVDGGHALKAAGRGYPKGFKKKSTDGAVLIMIFEKPSTRTRVSFDVAITQLGGHSVVLKRDEIQLGRGESVEDTAKVLSRYGDAIMIRALSHKTLLSLADHATIPVINGLTDKTHPCQIIAAVMTVEEEFGNIKGQKIAWIGDGNNVAVSMIHAAVKLGFQLDLACPSKYTPPQSVIKWAADQGGSVRVMRDPADAVRDAVCVYTDTWVSMGDKDAATRKRLFKSFRVDRALMKKAADKAIFLHCLPAYRGQEVTSGVIDGPQSRVFDEAENRLHAQKSILAWCLENR